MIDDYIILNGTEDFQFGNYDFTITSGPWKIYNQNMSIIQILRHEINRCIIEQNMENNLYTIRGHLEQGVFKMDFTDEHVKAAKKLDGRPIQEIPLTQREKKLIREVIGIEETIPPAKIPVVTEDVDGLDYFES